jgi:hypothetical protein
VSAAWAAAPRRWTLPELRVRAEKGGPVDGPNGHGNRPSERRTLSLALAAGLRLQGSPSR